MMRTSSGMAAVVLLVGLPLIAQDVSPVRQNAPVFPGTEIRPRDSIRADSPISSAKAVHRTETVYEPITIVDPKPGGPKVEYRAVQRVLTEKVPTDPAEIESLRKQLKELQERRIESLTPAELATEVLSATAEAKEREAWTKLQEAKKLLNQIAAEFPSTKAARIGVDAQNLIPANDMPRDLTPSAPVPLNPLPTY